MSDVRGRVGKYRGFWMSFVALLFATMCVCSPALAQDVDMSDDDVIDDDSTTSITITDNSQDNDQLCAPIVNQYNNVTQGGANALAGGDAVATVANKAEVSNSTVINCLNGDGNPVGGAAALSPAEENTEEETTEETTEEENSSSLSRNAAVANSADSPNFCSAGTQLESAQLTQDDADGISFTADDSGFAVEATNIEGTSSDGGAGLAGVTVVYDESTDDDKGGELQLAEDVSQTVDESGTFTLTADEGTADYDSYTVTVSYCEEDTEDENSTQSRQSSVMDGTYDKTATLANTGGQTDGMMSASTVSSVAIPAGALCLVVSAGLAVGMRSRYRG